MYRYVGTGHRPAPAGESPWQANINKSWILEVSSAFPQTPLIVQFATLADYTNFTDKMLRSTMLMPDEGRRKIGMKNLPDGIGRSIFATKNYVILNNEEMNDVINNGVGGTNNEGAN